MYTVEIWERGLRLWALLRSALPESIRERTAFYRGGTLPPGIRPDLVVIAPQWPGSLADISCRCLLIPGHMGVLARKIAAGWVVSYGPDKRDTLTLSSLRRRNLCAALQREVVTLDGTTVERQELPLGRGDTLSSLHALACVGTQLLLGVPPEEVRLTGLARPSEGMV